MTDEELIRRTLRLAERGMGRVSPNPMVGAVIVNEGKIVGQGYHRFFGGPHAEVEAFRNARNEVREGTLYVNLEPCCHHGKQPPCVESIVHHQINRVVIGTPDPNPIVNGKGVAYLRERGLEVRVSVLSEACEKLNRAYFKYMTAGRPFVTVKIAQTLDGKISGVNGRPMWITSEQSRRLVHKMRSRHDAVLVGIGTVLADNPRLTVRYTKGRNPKRVVLDGRLRIPLECHLLTDEFASKTIVATSEKADEKKLKQIQKLGAAVWRLRQDATARVNLKSLLEKLARSGIASVLVEGGSEVFSSFLSADLVDRAEIFIAPKILGRGVAAIRDLNFAKTPGGLFLRDVTRRKIGDDLLISGTVSLN